MSSTTRLSVEIPSNEHKKLKILADANGLTEVAPLVETKIIDY